MRLPVTLLSCGGGIPCISAPVSDGPQLRSDRIGSAICCYYDFPFFPGFRLPVVLSWYLGLRNVLAAALLLSALDCPAQNLAGSAGANLDPYPPDSPGASHASLDLRVRGANSDGWLFPVTELNKSLPSWLQFGAEFRDRVEGQVGLHYAPTNDIYDLTQLRIGIYIQPTSWFKIVSVTQDARVFFNQHVPNEPSYQNIWDLREAYATIGDGDSSWMTATVGREVLSFGDEAIGTPAT
ncbi:MAG: hypothetical protein JO182_15550 [Acidobacteriaceae bacterium]|nr:hypothetical protein [Acidobacteriaceae bacterium]